MQALSHRPKLTSPRVVTLCVSEGSARSLRRLALATLIGLGPVPEVRAQPEPEIRLPSSATCNECEVRLEQIATLGTDSTDGYLSDYPLSVSMDARGRIFVTLQPPGDLVLTYDTKGRFLGRIGRKGRGPGEYVFPAVVLPQPNGDLFIWDFNTAALTRLDATGTVRARTHQANPPTAMLRSGRQLIVSAMFDTRRIAFPLHVANESGDIVYSFGESGRSYAEAERWRLSRTVAVGERGTAWVAHVDGYILEEWDVRAKPRRVRRFTRSVDWMPPITIPSAGVYGEKPTARVEAMWEDPSGRLWVFSRVAALRWVEALGPARIPPLGRATYPLRDQGRLFDTMIDVIDLRTNRLLVSQRVRAHSRFSLGGGLIAVYREEADATPLLDVVRVRLVTRALRREP